MQQPAIYRNLHINFDPVQLLACFPSAFRKREMLECVQSIGPLDPREIPYIEQPDLCACGHTNPPTLHIEPTNSNRGATV